MKRLLVLTVTILVLGCGKDDPPKTPEAATLSFPQQNSECTTGVDLNAITSQVEFRWQQAKNTDTYELRVANINNGISQTVTTSALSAQLPLQKGAPYSWNVITRNTKTEVIATSETWQFYNAGVQTTYAPFPASIVAPKSGATIIRDINNEVTLQWNGADVDNDISSFEIYLDTVSPPVQLEASPSVSLNVINVNVSADTVYYWKVITKDREGNSSDSGVYSFKTL